MALSQYSEGNLILLVAKCASCLHMVRLKEAF